MKRDVSAIAADLGRLRAADFEEGVPGADGMDLLRELCDELLASGSVTHAAPLLFEFSERLDGAYLGSPGPIVHTLEKMPGYEPYLRESLRRKPTSLSLWMANRIANAHRPDRAEWVGVLEAIASDPGVRPDVREDAASFVRHQRAA